MRRTRVLNGEWAGHDTPAAAYPCRSDRLPPHGRAGSRFGRAARLSSPRSSIPMSRDAPHFKPGMRLHERVDQGLETSDPEELADSG